MGIPDNSILDLVEKARSWISWAKSGQNSTSGGLQIKSCKICSQCDSSILESSLNYHCQNCGRVLCGNCARERASGHLEEKTETVFDIKFCKFCLELGPRSSYARMYSGKVHPAESPSQNPESPSPSFSGERFDDHSPHALAKNIDTSFSNHPYPVSDPHSPSRSNEDEGEDSTSRFFSASSNCLQYVSDVDLSSVSARHGNYSFTSVGSSSSDSPSRIHIISDRVGHHVQQEKGGTVRSQNDGPYDQETMAVLKVSGYPKSVDHLSIFQNKHEKPLDFEPNHLIWLPPAPDDVSSEAENNFFTFDDEDDEVGELGAMFSATDSLDSMFLAKEKLNLIHKQPLKAVVQGYFRSLVSQLLHVHGIMVSKENCAEDWLDIIMEIAWQAANFVKPDTSRGGSMDPCDYVKVKCVASGSPRESMFVKGVVCSKNIKHKRMTSQYVNPRLLLLGGALEYQRVPNQLASFDTLLQQENDHLKMIVSKIEFHHPNVLLVEKSVSSFAQEHLLAKEISLVLNIKRPLLERIARCTGATITPSVDHLSTTRLGYCELFHLERVSEDHELLNQFNKKPSKTLMFFEGCPRRFGCTVVLKGSCRQELKKVKCVLQYAIFAAYHLSLETSFLADEGASLPKVAVKPSSSMLMRMGCPNNSPTVIPISAVPCSYPEEIGVPSVDIGSTDFPLELGLHESLSELSHAGFDDPCMANKYRFVNAISDACDDNLSGLENYAQAGLLSEEEGQSGEVSELAALERVDEIEDSSECYSANDGRQSILVSFSSHHVLNRTVCERSRLMRIKFYGPSDKPLGRYLRDDLFDKLSCCRSCKEPAEAHVTCYTHPHGNLTVNVRHVPSVSLPGERDGKIWMWHRCLMCAPIDGVPPATQKVVMSDSAWGLSFGKFLELSFSNHATANRVASCGHSLQRDCLRFYGFGSIVAFFQYSPIDILSVCLPPSILEFSGHGEQTWIRKEASELLNKAEALYAEISAVLHQIEQKSSSFTNEFSKDSLLLVDEEILDLGHAPVDILEVNRLRHSLIMASHFWDRRLCLLDSLLNRSSTPNAQNDDAAHGSLKESDAYLTDSSIDFGHEDNAPDYSKLDECPNKAVLSKDEVSNFSLLESGFLGKSISSKFELNVEDGMQADKENAVNNSSLERLPSAGSILSEKIDSAWTGTDQPPIKESLLEALKTDVTVSIVSKQIIRKENPACSRLMLPTRVFSFDSAQRLHERISKGLPPSSLHLSNLRSFHASGDYKYMIRDPVPNVQRTYSQILPHEAEKLNLSKGVSPSFISSISLLPEGARLMIPQTVQKEVVIAVYDDEPTSIISYVLSCKEYEEWIADKPNRLEGGLNISHTKRVNSLASDLSTWQSFGSLDLDYIHYGSYDDSVDTLAADGSQFTDAKGSPHLRISFEDESSSTGGKVKFSVVCYFAKQFDALWKRCCPSNVDFVRSLSRCRRWSAQGGKSNAYFAKSFDERFIIKQVTKTELESFGTFAPEYFKYLTDSLSPGNPTCLAKVLGIYQVTIKYSKGGKETKMDLMVMENIFFKRSISMVYDLKGSARSRYNSDTTGTNKVLLDMNLLETLRTKPIFLGSKAKRSLERAVWNDTSFLASVDVMDYSLLVGVDEERKELVVGIIDFMRQYTWDKQLETLVKASGLLGGPKHASPTIISPKQYKKRFRKAMTTYFLTVPDQWP
ncbi:1-phosphatidylinositol-3-phosphate 5-kinase FAB1C [Olea europaea subsp. europaea]|uniref:1-phosphatidylinositol-3-phosphate 5-kinase n=1 Tax=Olea europaea subsp. europaea TaxID=158383 RepID=A0A8S0VM79_OLEEU|nr:1-phosphatidylinositol-3-phosphate 5-kinase FAB1C [Olea europaea subsp. europaea]